MEVTNGRLYHTGVGKATDHMVRLYGLVSAAHFFIDYVNTDMALSYNSL
jgi:hypothetical protein